MHRYRFCYLLWAVATSGCVLTDGLKVREVAGGAARPANVAEVVSVTERGEPVASLQPSAFHVLENGQSLENSAIDLRLLPPDVSIAFSTVLLLDQGPDTTPQVWETLVAGANRLLEKLHSRQNVTVLAFDGGKKARVLGANRADATATAATLVSKQLKADKDPSRNLRGAVLDGIEQLDLLGKQSQRPVQIGSLVLVALGPDLASRTTAVELTERLGQSPGHRYFIGLNRNADVTIPSGFLPTDKVLTAGTENLAEAFDTIATKIQNRTNSYYVVSYCSPARAESPQLRLEVSVVSDDLHVDTSAIERTFNATGFTSNCSSSRIPSAVWLQPNSQR